MSDHIHVPLEAMVAGHDAHLLALAELVSHLADRVVSLETSRDLDEQRLPTIQAEIEGIRRMLATWLKH